MVYIARITGLVVRLGGAAALKTKGLAVRCQWSVVRCDPATPLFVGAGPCARPARD